jgi:ribosomal protein S18 acetylase RimI-like enzyme
MTARHSPPLDRLTLRAACEDDFETLYAIDQVCYSTAVAYTRAELRWYLRLRGAECTVAEMRTRIRGAQPRARIAGFIVGVSQRTHGHIVTIDVLEMHRRAGVGSSLLQHAEKTMARRGVTQVWLETATNNEPAIAFWKKHGYRSHGRLPNYYPDGLDAFAMSKSFMDSAPRRTEEQ